MARIQQLSASLVNMIAAGEVIERPASVVKELLENALDAHARRIDVVIQQGGMEFIRVVDDGEGIASDDLSLAAASHATSKLRGTEDLFCIGTLGFRGEALASMAEVAHLRIRSRPRESAVGAEIRIEGGKASPIEACPSAPGSTVEVANLFFNTPVRRRFMRSSQTEMGHLLEAFNRVALAHPEVHFTLQHNDRMVVELPPADAWQHRIHALCGADIAGNLLPIDRQQDGIHLHGFAVHPTISRGNNRSQYFFLNRRYIRDRSLSHALAEAYRGLLLVGRYPLAFLQIDMPTDLVDVNVHPTKMEVRFADSGGLYSLVLGALRSEFLRCDLTVRGRTAASIEDPGVQPLDPLTAADPGSGLTRRAEVSLWASPFRDEADLALARTRAAAVGAKGGTASVPPFQPFPGGTEYSLRVPVGPMRPPTPSTTPAIPSDNDALRPNPVGAGSPPSMQVCNRYLVTETEDGLMVIDQHALHERVLYEELKARIARGQPEQQRLLVPEPVELPAAEAGLVLEHREMLERLGMAVEPFSGNTVLVTSYPAMLANLSPSEILHKIAEHLLEATGPLEQGPLIDELLHMIACKAAIKAGDRLTAQEVASLVELRHLVHDAHHCPHGRPSTLVFTRAELDRQFRRT